MNYVYCAFYAPGLFKIGFSGNPDARCKVLIPASYYRPELSKVWVRPKGDARKVEFMAHKILAEFCVGHKNYPREVFKCIRKQAHGGIERAVWLTDMQRPVVPRAPLVGAVLPKMGYAPVGAARKDFLRIARSGVYPDQIYDDAKPLIKASRPGDVIVMTHDTTPPWPAEKLAERGITLEFV